MHMLETYKLHDDTFALCEGNLSIDNLRVLTVSAANLNFGLYLLIVFLAL